MELLEIIVIFFSPTYIRNENSFRFLGLKRREERREETRLLLYLKQPPYLWNGKQWEKGEGTGRKTFPTRVSCSTANTMHVSDRAVCREIVGRRAHNWTGYRVSRRRRNFDQRIYDIYIYIYAMRNSSGHGRIDNWEQWYRGTKFLINTSQSFSI